MCLAAPASRRRAVCLDGAIVSRLTPTKFCKLMLTSNQEEFLFGQYLGHECVIHLELRSPLSRREYLRADLPAELLLCWMQGVDNRAEIRRTDDQNVDVAAGRFSAARNRAEDKRNLDARSERRERLDQHIRQAHRFTQNAGEFGIDLMGSVGGVLQLIPDALAVQQAHLMQSGQFLIQGSRRGAGQPRYLAYVQSSSRMQQQQREYLPAVPGRKQQSRSIGMCSFHSYDRSMKDYNIRLVPVYRRRPRSPDPRCWRRPASIKTRSCSRCRLP